MIRTLTVITKDQLLADLKHVDAGGILKMDTWNALYDWGLVDTVTDADGYMRDVLTESGRKVLAEGQGNNE